MSRHQDLHELPPIARAEALDQPYQPGRMRRQILVGAVVVAGLLALFLAWMPHSAPRQKAMDATPSGVVYQNLRAPPAPPPPRDGGGGDAAEAATP